jgi:hypothetical protein
MSEGGMVRCFRLPQIRAWKAKSPCRLLNGERGSRDVLLVAKGVSAARASRWKFACQAEQSIEGGGAGQCGNRSFADCTHPTDSIATPGRDKAVEKKSRM